MVLVGPEIWGSPDQEVAQFRYSEPPFGLALAAVLPAVFDSSPKMKHYGVNATKDWTGRISMFIQSVRVDHSRKVVFGGFDDRLPKRHVVGRPVKNPRHIIETGQSAPIIGHCGRGRRANRGKVLTG
jgi:hypothetical protein